MRISDAHPAGCGVCLKSRVPFVAVFFFEGWVAFLQHIERQIDLFDTLGFAEDVSLYLRC